MGQNASVYHADRACIVCGATRWTALPDPGTQSIASDLRIVPEPLAKLACAACALAMRRQTAHASPGLYAEGYELYAHRAGGGPEHVRQHRYADWIASMVVKPPSRVLDVGCGNGSLLLALREQWPGAMFLGCDASADSVAHGDETLRLWQGTSATLDAGLGADLVVSVNVIEHTSDPAAFVADLARAAARDATVVVVCPDGSHPGVELLFADHFWSFTPMHVSALFARAGLAVIEQVSAPPALGSFQMVAGRRERHHPETTPAPDPAPLNERRARYLDRWRRLDAALGERLAADVVCFGTGEAAGLLRSYAPQSWSRVRACTHDAASDGRFGPIPVVPIDAVPRAAHLLLAVRPQDQPTIAARLDGRFARVTTWYDLVGDEW